MGGGANALFFKNTNSLIMLNSILFSELSVIFEDNLASFNRKVYSK